MKTNLSNTVRAGSACPLFTAAALALAIAFTLGCEEKKSAEQIEAEKAKLAELAAIEAAAAAPPKEEEATPSETLSCKDGEEAKLPESIDGTKFEYDGQNRIVKIGNKTIAYADDMITVKEGGSVANFAIKGNTAKAGKLTLTLDKEGRLVSLKDGSRTMKEEKNGKIVDAAYFEKYEYQGGNLTGVSDNNGDGENFFGSFRSYGKYDSKKSPFSNSNTPKWLLQYLAGSYYASKNNALEHHSGGGDYAITWAYKYKYDKDGFPTEQTGELDLGGGDNLSGGPTRTTTSFAYLCNKTGADAGGAFKDDRDGKSYKTAKIGTQTWMAENLNYETGNSWCYDNDKSNCDKYGRLYDWETAKKACPKGWHLPSKEEWQTLVNFAGGKETAGKKLKSASGGWRSNDISGSGNGTDEFGFAAMPGGQRIMEEGSGSFQDVEDLGVWWTATKNTSGSPYGREMMYNDVGENTEPESSGLSVRCVKD